MSLFYICSGICTGVSLGIWGYGFFCVEVNAAVYFMYGLCWPYLVVAWPFALLAKSVDATADHMIAWRHRHFARRASRKAAQTTEMLDDLMSAKKRERQEEAARTAAYREQHCAACGQRLAQTKPKVAIKEGSNAL